MNNFSVCWLGFQDGINLKRKRLPFQTAFLCKYKSIDYTTPCANIASATLTNPAMFAPRT